MFLAADGDDIGSEIERLIIISDKHLLSQFWKDITKEVSDIEIKLKSKKARIILCGGDSILAELPEQDLHNFIAEVFGDLKHMSFSIGAGTSMLEAYIALKMAKSSGKKCWVDYRDLSSIQQLGK